MPSALRRWSPRNGRTLLPAINRRAVTEGGDSAGELEVNDWLYNKPINPTPFAASRRLLSQAARPGSCAGYRHRCTDKNTGNGF
jgi:hypothetical protein